MIELPDSPNTRAEQFAFLREAHDGPSVWKGLCLSLARQAPGLPAVYPSALAAAHGTPEDRRVYDVADLRRGMVAYFDDPDDSNPYAHIATVAGWAGDGRTLDDLSTWTNDARRTGGVDLVRASFFPDYWGDSFLFGATSLNGYDLPGYGPKQPKPEPGHIGAQLDQAIAALRKAIRHHRKAGHTAIVKALAADLAELKETRRKFPR